MTTMKLIKFLEYIKVYKSYKQSVYLYIVGHIIIK